ncbi:hypothetical protein FB99_41580 (plasmid) [Pantoea agglomerans]|nr:hypothetical protein FB99_41580 [Pantoea agglomerans]
MRLAQNVGLQGMHIDALTYSCCDDFLKIKPVFLRQVW